MSMRTNRKTRGLFRIGGDPDSVRRLLKLAEHDGKFVVYHGTTPDKEESILELGLRPSERGETVTAKVEHAQQFAPMFARSVLRIEIPLEQVADYLEIEGEYGAASRQWALKKTIPGRYITRQELEE